MLGGSVTYAALAASRLGWQVAILTTAGPDFEPERDLPGVTVFLERSSATTRFVNLYDEDGRRRQFLSASSSAIELLPLPEEWRRPDVLLLGPVAGEMPAGMALAFEAQVVGAIAQGWVRSFDPDGRVTSSEWVDPGRDLAGVHVLFLSQHDLPEAPARARELLSVVPMVVLTQGWRGATLYSRDAVHEVPSLPRSEVDPTGAGDVFAATFLVRYHETGDFGEAAAFAACAASCAVEALGASGLGDRAEVERRLALRERLLEDGEWEE